MNKTHVIYNSAIPGKEIHVNSVKLRLVLGFEVCHLNVVNKRFGSFSGSSS